MKLKSYKIIEFIIFIIFLNPLICFLLFTLGFKINFHSINIFLLFIITVLSFLTYSRENKLHIFQIHLFVLLFLIINILMSIYNPINITSSVIDLIGYYIQIFSPLMIAVFFLKERINIIENFVFKIGIVVAFFNLFQYLLMLTSNYDLFIGYSKFLGMNDGYYEDLKALIVNRPLGYYFDVHAQVYLPLFSLILINKFVNNKLKKFLLILVILLGLLISGVKTAYLIGLIILFRRIIQVFDLASIFKTFLIIIFSTLILNYYLDSIVFNLIKRIIVHDLEILLIHLFEIPIFLIMNYPLIFLLGGQVFMENFIYSEVYLITLIFHIGIFGIIIYILIPNIILFIKGNNVQKDLVLIFILSLSHYYIFKVGGNIIGTSLIYAYILNLFILKNERKSFSSYNLL